MNYHEREIRKIQKWLTTELNEPGWNSSKIAKGLTDNAIDTISRQYNKLNSTSKQGILLALLCISKTDFLAAKEAWKKVLDLACKDSDEFVQITGNILKDYQKTNNFNLNIEDCSKAYRPLLDTIGKSIKDNGFHFHSLDYILMQPSARVPPTFAAMCFKDYKPTNLQHFQLNKASEYIISADERENYFKKIIQNEEKEENVKAKNIPLRKMRPTSEKCSSLYITKKYQTNPPKTMNKLGKLGKSAAHLKGFQKEKKTCMLNQSSAATFEKNNNIAIEKAKNDIKIHKKQKAICRSRT